MASKMRTGMRVPSRAAPRPPGQSSMYINSMWSSNNNLSKAHFSQPITQKKKPPPRPPPPKFQHNRQQSVVNQKVKKPTRPTQLLTNLFSRKEMKHQSNKDMSSNMFESTNLQSSSAKNTPVCLIDLSPPGSPTLTTRSSSDGLSVDSFGSDGYSNPSVLTSSGSTSQTESTFEDDFDFFGGLNSNRKLPSQNDPWKVSSDRQGDPFSPIHLSSSNSKEVKRVNEANFFAFNDQSFTNSELMPSSSKSTTTVSSYLMPTIIRAKPQKDILLKSTQSSSTNSSKTTQDFFAGSKLVHESGFDTDFQWKGENKGDVSPPMPSIPPPTLPPQFRNKVETEIQLQTEIFSSVESETQVKEPFGIALYDFQATQEGDLALKEGDTVILLNVVNDEWMEGRIGNRRGMFPTNFIDIKIPISGAVTNIVNALYTFKGETWEDLPFEEGARIKVLSRISDDWLYGECNGIKGQFPANYVDRVPSNLSLYR